MKEQKIIVKPILEDKFWIVEDSGVRIGTLVKTMTHTFIQVKEKFLYMQTKVN